MERRDADGQHPGILRLSDPFGVAVDAAGNVYIADNSNWAIKEYSPVTEQVTTLSTPGLTFPLGVAVDTAGNVFFTNEAGTLTELVKAYVPSNAISEPAAAGSASLAAVLPATQSLTGVFAPSSDQSWLTIGTVANGVIDFSFSANTGNAARTAHITVIGQQITVTQTGPTLSTASLLEGPAAGTDADIVASGGAWTATSNASWLHTSASGSGNGLAAFTFDANTGATRTGTLTIAGLTLSVTQAGSTYVAANPLTTLVASGLNYPIGLAVDGAGNVYIADYGDNTIEEWNATTQLATTVVSSGLNSPTGIAVDKAGNLYIADSGDNAIKEWNAANGLTTLVASGLDSPFGVAVDGAGNVYFADTGNNALKEWNAATQQVAVLASGLNQPTGVAVDGAGNVYIATSNGSLSNCTIEEWNAATLQVTPLVSSGLDLSFGLAVDGAGNLYIADTYGGAIKEWNAATQQLATLVSGQSLPYGVAVDAAGDVYTAYPRIQAVNELAKAYVPASPINENAAAGSDSLAVLPTTQSLTGVYAPTSDQNWLTIGNISNDVVNFSFTANTGLAARSAHITLLGQQMTVTQAGFVGLGATTLLEGPAPGGDTDIVIDGAAWSASSNAPWLHTTSSGSGGGLAAFTFDANTGATRSATLTIAGQTLTVTQAASNDIAANALVTLDASGLRGPDGVAVDANGNVYIADNNNNAIDRWDPTTNPFNIRLPAVTPVAIGPLNNVCAFCHRPVFPWAVSSVPVGCGSIPSVGRTERATATVPPSQQEADHSMPATLPVVDTSSRSGNLQTPRRLNSSPRPPLRQLPHVRIAKHHAPPPTHSPPPTPWQNANQRRTRLAQSWHFAVQRLG